MPPLPDYEALYADAVSGLLAAQGSEVKVVSDKSLQIGYECKELHTEKTIQKLGDSYHVTESIELNGIQDHFEETHVDGKLYLTIFDEFSYQGEVALEDYSADFVTVSPVNPGLYTSVSGKEAEGGMTITFADATSGETWAVPEGATLLNATATAKIGSDGVLAEVTYDAQYYYGGSDVTIQATVTPAAKEDLTIAAPEKADTFLAVTDVQAAKAYDWAILMLVDTVCSTTSGTEVSTCQAANAVFSIAYASTYCGLDGDLAAQVDLSGSLTSGSQLLDSYAQTETYIDGTYTVTANGESTSQPLDADSMYSYASGYMYKNAPALDYITDFERETVNGITVITFTLNEDLANEKKAYISNLLWADGKYLDSISSGFSDTTCGGYVAVEDCTGLPVSAAVTYSANHTVDGKKYALSYVSQQAFNLEDIAAYETVTGKPYTPSDVSSASKPTPLFYKVTGPNGQQMWLLGTIHVGDFRTDYLPQEIYSALEGSAALAVEFDIQAFEEALTTDANLINQVAAMYIASDGKVPSTVLSQEDCETARTLMNLGGNYVAGMEMMKPFVWSQGIEDFLLQQSYSVSSVYGVDNRLLTYAKDKNIAVRDIESGMEQLTMLSGFSTEIQTMMLESILTAPAGAYAEQTILLYNAWCEGDMELLTEMVNASDTEGMTPEEIEKYSAALDAYNKAMSTDRNEKMLSKAKEYLESGETVFFAVGLAHLLDQNNGLVKTLQEAGYTVELVQYK